MANFGDLSDGGNVSAMLQKDTGGTLAFSKKNYIGEAIPTGVAIGDFNGDGKLDIAAADGPTATIMFTSRPDTANSCHRRSWAAEFKEQT